MATVVNKTTLELRQSVNTPDYSADDWFINPTLPLVDRRYWTVADGQLVAMTEQEQAAVDAAELTAAKAARKLGLLNDTQSLVASRYPDPIREQLLSIFTRSGFAGLTNRATYLGALAAWADSASLAWATACAYVDAADSLEAVAAVTVDDSFMDNDPQVTIAAALAIED